MRIAIECSICYHYTHMSTTAMMMIMSSDLKLNRDHLQVHVVATADVCKPHEAQPTGNVYRTVSQHSIHSHIHPTVLHPEWMAISKGKLLGEEGQQADVAGIMGIPQIRYNFRDKNVNLRDLISPQGKLH